MLAAGFSPQEIRYELKLSARQYKYRVSLLRQKSADAPHVWANYRAKIDVRYAQLESIRQKADEEGKLDVARKAVSDMNKLDREIIEVGQMLGAYKKTPDVVELKSPSLGILHDINEIKTVEGDLRYDMDDNVSPDKKEIIH